MYTVYFIFFQVASATATRFGLSRGLLGLQYNQINESESESESCIQTDIQIGRQNYLEFFLPQRIIISKTILITGYLENDPFRHTHTYSICFTTHTLYCNSP